MILAEVIERNARLYPAKPALVFEGRSVSHAAFAARVKRLAAALASRGLRPGARLAVLAQNSIEHLEAYGAAETAGFILVGLNWRLAVPELMRILRDCEPEVLVFDDACAETAAALKVLESGPRCWISIGAAPPWAEAYETVLAKAGNESAPFHAAEDDTAYLLYTSGTTGAPKGVMLSHRAILSAARSLSWEGEALPTDRVLIVMPLCHIGARIEALSFALTGATIFLERRFDAAALLDLMEREAITAAHLAPTMIYRLLEAPDFARDRLASLRNVHYASAPMPVPLLRRALAAFGPIFIQIYGMTECIVATTLRAHQHVVDGTPADMRRLGSAGQPFFGVDLRVVRPDGAACQGEEIGEVLLRAPALMRGYWKSTAALSDGWLHTGDLGFLDGEGFLFLVDRLKDMIVSAGENIFSREVEEALLAHPAVAEAAVIGVPNPEWGESVKAIVVLRDGHMVRADELVAHCRTLIAGYKKPRSVAFVAALPRLFNGKIDKHRLRTLYAAG
jgi:acyl-CoA synthetase (AMP-forming)/AMP-acid ligase II